MKLVKEISRLIKKEPKQNKTNLVEFLLGDIQHEWILNDRYYFRAFKFLIEAIPSDKRSFFFKNRVLFLPSNGHLACALSQLKDCHTILVFPDLMKILKSPIFERGIAVLAHELGHLYYEHSYRNIDPSQAQFEADSLVEEMGLKNALVEILSEYNAQETKNRIAKLQSH